MAGNERKKGTLSQIIIPVAIALLVGTSSPWWLRYFSNGETLPKHDPKKQPNQGVPKNTVPYHVGSLVATTTVDPSVIKPGDQTGMTVFIQDAPGNPVSGAVVTLSSGGGKFKTTGTSTVSGPTDVSGLFRAKWSCTQCAPSYTGGVRATKSGFTEAQGQWRVDIR